MPAAPEYAYSEYRAAKSVRFNSPTGFQPLVAPISLSLASDVLALALRGKGGSLKPPMPVSPSEQPDLAPKVSAGGDTGGKGSELPRDLSSDGSVKSLPRHPLGPQELESIRLAMIVANRFSFLLNQHARSNSERDGVSGPLSLSRVEALLHEAIVAASETYGMAAAQIWADGFTFPEEARGSDAEVFLRHDMDFAQLCSEKRKGRAGDRLSEARVKSVLCGVKLTNARDYNRLLAISRGIKIETPKQFQTRKMRPHMRSKYVQKVSNAVNKLLYAQWLNGTVLLLPTELVDKIVGVHFSYQHWATKQNKACGRSICDTSNDDDPLQVPLNGMGEEGREKERQKLKKQWGEIVHPTLTDLVLMVLEAIDKYGAHNVELWKMDLAGAFNLMDFDPSAAKLLAFELTEGMTAIHTTGMFGWVGTPYVFQVITRVLADLCRPLLKGFMKWYVDDGMGISPINLNKYGNDQVARDMAEVEKVVRSLLGSGSIASDKSERGRRMVFIGWCFDLNTLTVTMSERNMLKTFYAFFTIDPNSATLEQVEKVSSYASRYAVLCRQMQPYTTALYGCISMFKGSRVSRRRLSKLARNDIELWRAFLCLLHLDPGMYARPFESFRPRRASVLIEYDACLSGFGVGVSGWSESEQKYALLAYTRLAIPYVTTNDSSNQNTCEYLAVLLGLLLIKHTKCVKKGFAFDLIGDNVTSLSWVKRGHVSSSLARRANVGMSLLEVDLDAMVADTFHIAGVYNVVYDGLSRGKSGSDVGLPPELAIEFGPDSLTVEYIRLCDPARELFSVDDHLNLSTAFFELLALC